MPAASGGGTPLLDTAHGGGRRGLSRRFHAQKYASLPNSRLVGVADPSEKARAAATAELGVPAHADYRELLGHVDAVSIVTPTPLHYAAAKDFLDAGASVLVEKPMTVTVAEGESLIALARRANRSLQVGHLERFKRRGAGGAADLDRAAPSSNPRVSLPSSIGAPMSTWCSI